MGMHDWCYNGHRVKVALEGANVPVLELKVARIEYN